MRNSRYSLLAILPKPTSELGKNTKYTMYICPIDFNYIPLNINKEKQITGIAVYSLRNATRFINRGVPTTACSTYITQHECYKVHLLEITNHYDKEMCS